MLMSPRSSGPSSISISNADKRVLLTNDAHLELLGRTTETVIGQNWQEWMAEADFLVCSDLFAKFLVDLEPYEVVTRIRRVDGTLIPVAARCSAIKGDRSGTTLMLCEMRVFDESFAIGPDDKRVQAARLVRDITYELAGLTAQRKLTGLTEALIGTSGSAEKALELMARALELPNG